MEDFTTKDFYDVAQHFIHFSKSPENYINYMPKNVKKYHKHILEKIKEFSGALSDVNRMIVYHLFFIILKNNNKLSLMVEKDGNLRLKECSKVSDLIDSMTNICELHERYNKKS